MGSEAVAVPGPAVQVYLATAAPMQAAEQERDRRAQIQRKTRGSRRKVPLTAEYRFWLEDNRDDANRPGDSHGQQSWVFGRARGPAHGG